MKNNYVWSAKNNAFFPAGDLFTYKSSGWDLSDVVNIENSVYDEFKNSVPGKVRGPGEDGLPCWLEAPNLTEEQMTAIMTAKKSSLISEAGDAIAPLQDAKDMGMATPEEENKLNDLKLYRIALSRVDISQNEIEWPIFPA